MVTIGRRPGDAAWDEGAGSSEPECVWSGSTAMGWA